jgi:hypothetical protein
MAHARTEPEPPYYIAITSYISFALLFIFGHVRDFWRQRLGRAGSLGTSSATPAGYAPLCKDYEDFYTRRLYMRIHDVFNRPIASAPDAWIEVVEREREGWRGYGLRRTERTRTCLNLGSYNYLGFAAADPYCTQRVRSHRAAPRRALQEGEAGEGAPGLGLASTHTPPRQRSAPRHAARSTPRLRARTWRLPGVRKQQGGVGLEAG